MKLPLTTGSDFNDRRARRSGLNRPAWLVPAVAFIMMLHWPMPQFTVAAQLSAGDFRQIGEQGFGDLGNSYAWSIANFKGKIYIGSNRHFICMVSSLGTTGTDTEFPPKLPVDCEPDRLDMDLRARLWCYNPNTDIVELVYVSPTTKAIRSDGTWIDVPRDHGYRTMTVFTEPDGTEALYIGTYMSRKIPGLPARILRTTDGINFSEVWTPYSETDGINAFRTSVVYKNRYYIGVIGDTLNNVVIMESSDPTSGDFRVVNDPGFGDPTNAAIYTMAVFNDHLYVGTGNNAKGFQLFKTRAIGEPPYFFEPVMVDGAYRGPPNEAVVSMGVYKDHLYVGSGKFGGQIVATTDAGAAAAELLRIGADDRWVIVCGEPRDTPAGFKYPIAGQAAGFGNPFVGYIWSMTEHDDVLYVGTFDKSFSTRYSEDMTWDDLENWPVLSEIMKDSGVNLADILEQYAAYEGGFDLWSTTDGVDWTMLSRTGFGEEFNYGVRNFLSTPYGLYLGTANPFYGFEIFLGQPAGTDSDGDGYPDATDNCPFTSNPSQSDVDKDSVGDECDNDNDNDCIPDDIDPVPGMPDPDALDTDNDGITDRCDIDDDNDDILDRQDNCPLAANFDQLDDDGDGIGDACQPVQNQADVGQLFGPSTGNQGNNSGTSSGDGANASTPPAAVPLCGFGILSTLGITFFVFCVARLQNRSRRH